ncbi:hypothetical protein [Priestia megaterium]|uniref:hypothetical protein n=1 Tax=Priestia megaterium TaxID=1404 RepID=UPI000BFBD279|nr:hypothetical protein [Priestia megaterium]PGY48499.1 hypothetical protein COE35_23820 [Priestia megaterium]
MANDSTLEILGRLQNLTNPTVEVVTNFGSITGEVQGPLFNGFRYFDYVPLEDNSGGYVCIPLSSIVALILLNEDGDL